MIDYCIFLLQITVLVQTTGVKMAGVVQSAGVVATGVAVREDGVASFVTKVRIARLCSSQENIMTKSVT